jgi:hypothetical protein
MTTDRSQLSLLQNWQPQALACAGTGWKAYATGKLFKQYEKIAASKRILHEAQLTT